MRTSITAHDECVCISTMLRTRNRESVTAIVARPLLESCDELPPDSMLPLALISNERGDVCGALVGVQRDELRAAG